MKPFGWVMACVASMSLGCDPDCTDPKLPAMPDAGMYYIQDCTAECWTTPSECEASGLCACDLSPEGVPGYFCCAHRPDAGVCAADYWPESRP